MLLSFIVVIKNNKFIFYWEMSTILSNKHGGFVTSFEMTNFSSAKQKFSFGKGARFMNAKFPETEL